jgi:hypothetical protein
VWTGLVIRFLFARCASISARLRRADHLDAVRRRPTRGADPSRVSGSLAADQKQNARDQGEDGHQRWGKRHGDESRHARENQPNREQQHPDIPVPYNSASHHVTSQLTLIHHRSRPQRSPIPHSAFRIPHSFIIQNSSFDIV